MSKLISGIKKPTFLFIFTDETRAKKFFDFANRTEASLVQHPFDINQNCKRDTKKVLVTGLGSTLFDISLMKLLSQEATNLGGQYVPKVI